MLEILDAAAVRRWSEASLSGLARAREEIDSINVFPVADSDTGTNLYLTMKAAAEALANADSDDLRAALRALANGALLGARGNSGVIVSQLLRGMATGLGDADRPDGRALADALAAATDLGYQAVGRPVEGTILTVARAAAEAAAISRSAVLAAVATAAARGAGEALAATTGQLEALRRAGVVDAGGRGLCVLLDALAEVITDVVPAPGPAAPMVVRPAGEEPTHDRGPAYEVMYLLDADDGAIPTLREHLATIGDSVVVVGGDRLWNVHVHLDDPGAAIEAGIGAGRPYRIKITDLRDGDGDRREIGAARRTSHDDGGRRAVIATASAAGVADLLGRSGAAVARRRPGAIDPVEPWRSALSSADADEIVLVAEGSEGLAAEAAAAEARAVGRRVAVIPARSCVQVIAAVAVHDPTRAFDADVIAMSAAAGGARHGQILIAAEEAVTSAGMCRPGDVLGLVDDDVAIIGSKHADVARAVIDRMLDAGGELVTLITGLGAERELATELVARLRRGRPEIECVAYDGGLDDCVLLIGVE